LKPTRQQNVSSLDPSLHSCLKKVYHSISFFLFVLILIICKDFTFRYQSRNAAYPSKALKIFLKDAFISFENYICIDWKVLEVF